ncbi:MAG: hypothetical protein IJ479_01235 [Alphaproteobacteria bacterium]|nr:hypothetical protein [Alphaproteobacteria bacterium]
MENYFERLHQLLNENGYKCNADGRKFMYENMPAITPRNIGNDWKRILQYAEKVGGFSHGAYFSYRNAQNEVGAATAHNLYNLPSGMTNPILVCFGGMMTAPLFAMEILRFYAKQHNQLLPFLAIGKEGNKGLFEKVFNRKNGIIIQTEYQAYLNIMEKMAPSDYVRANEQAFQDTDTAGNLIELYNFAKKQGMKEVTYILCTGNPFYDKRLFAEWLLMLKDEKFSEVKINLVIAHCPLFLDAHVPEGHLSELLLGYAAASIGPLMKDTISFDGQTSSSKPERYLMPGMQETDWEQFRNLICHFSNMGWPNYQEILYGVEHKEAVANIIISDLQARQSFTAQDYDNGILADIADYQKVIGKYESGDFKEYLKNTPDTPYFN